jgi:predicted small secreted protein
MKQKALVAFLLALSTLAAACNTVQGVGKDVERGGEKLQDAARDAKK